MKFTQLTMREILKGAGLNKTQAKEATAKIIAALAATLAKGEPVELRGLGSLEVRERKAHKTCNPKTGEPVNVPFRRRIIFHPGMVLKKTVKEGKYI